MHQVNFSKNSIESANDWDFGSEGAPIVIMIKAMNFSLLKIPTTENGFFKKIRFTDIFANYLTSSFLFIRTDLCVCTTKGVFIVKNDVYNEMSMPWNSIIMILLNVIIVSLFAYVKKKFQFENEFWSVFNVILILLSRGEVSFPRGKIACVVFLVLLIISITFTIEMVQQIFDYSFVKKKINAFTTYDELINSNKTFYTKNNTLILFKFLSEFHPNKKVIPKNVKLITQDANYNNDVELMLTTKCNLLYERDDIATMLTNLINKNESLVNIVPLSIEHQIYISYLVTYKSPYLQKFNKLLRRIFESGITSFCEKRAYFDYVYLKKSELSYKYNIPSESDTVEAFLWSYNKKNFPTKQTFVQDVDIALHVKLLYFCAIGLLLSMITFVIEFVHYRYFYKK